ncbi:hypothetical protein B0H67DRAFT_638073 [Lasiosphaeris hirsuta]|uniref:Uncharacterized protein n=1 Tax=Lasiosphaeris hirsuta TaxID=260670 RepID=A0AA40B8H5_9PEZI|nr:hypothetical protein B0H67DRAFT_638073 [Lasiosphaeris hirsuta]
MLSVAAGLDFLAKIPLYEREKPYHVLPSAERKLSQDLEAALTNVQWEATRLTIQDTRDHPPFELENFQSKHDYLDEVAKFLKGFLTPQPELIISLDCKIRKSIPFGAGMYNVNDPLMVEGIPVGVHVFINVGHILNYSLDIMPEITREA